MLLSGGGEVGVVIASCIVEINVSEVGVVLLVGHDGAHNLVAHGLSLEVAEAHVQVLQ